MTIDPYKILEIEENATYLEIKNSYRELVKKHHPDAGGDQNKILSINAAWEILGDKENKRNYDFNKEIKNSSSKKEQVINTESSRYVQNISKESTKEEKDLFLWMKNVYTPIDKLIGQILNSFPSQLRKLSADPYDDLLMESFCNYLEASQKKIETVTHLYQKISAPAAIQQFSLRLYYCFSQVQDALKELELYTNGYVDNYLHDGNEMLREAKKNRSRLHEIRRELPKY